MFLSTDDFRIKSENFDLSRSENIVRLACGAFYLPHALGKFTALGVLNSAIVKFFAAAGLSPPEAWVYIAAAAEVAVAFALILGLCTRFAALGSVALMAVAVYSLQTVKGFGWTWNTGGYEYPVFWGICSLAVAVQAWKAWAGQSRRALGGQPMRMAPAE